MIVLEPFMTQFLLAYGFVHDSIFFFVVFYAFYTRREENLVISEKQIIYIESILISTRVWGKCHHILCLTTKDQRRIIYQVSFPFLPSSPAGHWALQRVHTGYSPHCCPQDLSYKFPCCCPHVQSCWIQNPINPPVCIFRLPFPKWNKWE